MSGSTSDAGRFWQGTPGAPAIKNAWGTFLNDNAGIISQLVTGYGAVAIGGLGTYTLTTANWTSDQARPAMIDFTGALAGNCTVTIPNVQRRGYVRNSTTGSHNVLLTSGGGTVATIYPDSKWYMYWCDGSGNVSVPNDGFYDLYVKNTLTANGLTVAGAASVGNGLSVTGASSVTGTLTVSTAAASGNQVVNYSQFAPLGTTNGYTRLPGNLLLQWGTASITTGGPTTINWPTSFSSSVFSVTLTKKNASAGTPPSFGVGTVTLTTFQALTNAGVTTDAYFQAIGQ